MSGSECSRFKGRDKLLTRLNRAVAAEGVETITAEVEATLQDLIRDGVIELPERLRTPIGRGYARRLLHRSEDLGYTVIAMTWGRGQGTPVHDHAGTWCVEGVLQGQIEVTQYDLVEEDEPRCRFSREGTVHAGVGSAGSLIPPFEYHTIHNPDRHAADAVTIHVYGAELYECGIYVPEADGWYRRQVKQLGYDA